MTTVLIIVLVLLLAFVALVIGGVLMALDRVADLFREPWNRKHDGQRRN
jgi:cytochrome c-type biogenesis protein CcmE